MSLEWLITFAVIALGLAVLVAAFLISKRQNREPNYQAIFRLSIIFLAVGIGGIVVDIFRGSSSGVNFFVVFGLIYLAIGLICRDKWRKKH